MQKEIIKFKKAPTIISTYSVVGKKEHEGPLGDFFDEYNTAYNNGSNGPYMT